MQDMRTTLTIDDDLAGLLKRRARELGVSFKDMVNRTIRAGLDQDARPKRRSAPSSPTNSKPRPTPHPRERPMILPGRQYPDPRP
jgi:hypothetical protein